MSKMIAKIAFILSAIITVINCQPIEVSNDCEGKPDGVYAVSSDNKEYYVCIGEELMVRLKCNKGEHFDVTMKNCVKDFDDGGNDKDDLTNALESEMKMDENDDDINNVKSEISEILRQGEDEPDNSENNSLRISKRKVINFHVSKNIFPKSLMVIGKFNNEQKNT